MDKLILISVLLLCFSEKVLTKREKNQAGAIHLNFNDLRAHLEALEHHRMKRKVGPGAVLDVAFTAFDIYSAITGEEDQEQLEKDIKDLNRKVDQLLDAVAKIESQQGWQETATVYADDISRLMFLINVFTQLEWEFDANGDFVVTDLLVEWVQAVISLQNDGLIHVLDELHHMVMGSGSIFSPTPILASFMSKLDLDNANSDQLIESFYNFTILVQYEGYVLLHLSYFLNSRHDDALRVWDLANERMDMQQEYMNEIYDTFEPFDDPNLAMKCSPKLSVIFCVLYFLFQLIK